MNENNKRSAIEDLRVIRGVLDQTTSSLRGLAPLFWRLGLVWLVCALVLLYIEGGAVLGFLFPKIHDVFELFGAASMPVCTGVRIFLGAFLVVQCILWQRKKTSGELSEQGRRLLGLWQTLLVLYLCLYAVAAVGTRIAEPDVMTTTEAWDAWQTCSLLKMLPPVLFPALPPLLTGVYLEDRPLQLLGLVVLTLYLAAVVISMVSIVMVAQSGTNAPDYLIILSIVFALVRFVLPPASLLMTARRIKKLEKAG